MKSEASAAEFRTRFASLGAAGSFPLAVLFGLNFVDEFDRVAFSTLAPEIRDAMGASDATIVTVASLATALAVMMALPLGYIADRTNRVGISVAAALMWCFGAVATGLAGALTLIAVARFSSGTGRLVNDSIHPSLLSDYYAPKSLPFVSAVHRSATPLGAIVAAPIAGLAATAFGWRATFFIAAVPTVLLLVLAARLIDPRPRQALVASAPVKFWSSARSLWEIPTVRRLWLLAFAYGAAFIPFVTTLLSLFLEQVHGLDAGARGLMLALYGIGGVVGLFLGSRLTRRAFSDGRSPWMLQLAGGSILLFAIALVVATTVPLAVTTLLIVVMAIGTNAYLPPYTTLIALVTEQRLRSQGYAYSLFFLALGGILFGRVSGLVAESHGMKTAFLLLAIPAALAGIGALLSASLAQRDARLDPAAPPADPEMEV